MYSNTDLSPYKFLDRMVGILLESGRVKRVTKYLSDKLLIKATLQRKMDKRDKSHTVVVTVGRPNYTEREFIKLAKKAGESFPIKKLQLKLVK